MCFWPILCVCSIFDGVINFRNILNRSQKMVKRALLHKLDGLWMYKCCHWQCCCCCRNCGNHFYSSSSHLFLLLMSTCIHRHQHIILQSYKHQKQCQWLEGECSTMWWVIFLPHIEGFLSRDFLLLPFFFLSHNSSCLCWYLQTYSFVFYMKKSKNS